MADGGFVRDDFDNIRMQNQFGQQGVHPGPGLDADAINGNDGSAGVGCAIMR